MGSPGSKSIDSLGVGYFYHYLRASSIEGTKSDQHSIVLDTARNENRHLLLVTGVINKDERLRGRRRRARIPPLHDEDK